MVNINEDISKLTNIHTKYLNKIDEASIYAINEAVKDSILECKNETVVDVGIGVLHVQVVDNEVRYKFIPSKKLETSIRTTIIEEQNLLEHKLEANLVSRITRLYKELL